MKIKSKKGKANEKSVVITGSPHKDRTASLLAERFIEGAESNGHKIVFIVFSVFLHIIRKWKKRELV